MLKRRKPHRYEEQIISEIEQRLPALRSFAMGLCGDRFVADDLVQSACERALERLGQVRDLAGVGSWLNRIIYTQWQDILRKRTRRKAKLLSFGHHRNQLQRGGTAPGENTTIAKLDIEKGLDLLSNEQRAVLALVLIAGHSYQEAAAILDLPVGTVASRVARAKAMLADHLHPRLNTISEDPDYRRQSDEYNR